MGKYDHLVDFLPREMEFWGVPGFSYGFWQNGEVLAKGGFGYRDTEKTLPCDADTLYGIASCSKSFNSCLIAILVDEGILDYDRPIREYIPDFQMYDPVATRDCTLRDMLAHRTGLAPHEAMWPDPNSTKADLVRRLRYLKPNAPFRSVAQYNNTIYSAIGGIAEIVTGKSWESLIEEKIFKPLGMTNSLLSAHKMYEQPNHAQGHWDWEDGKGPVPVGPWEMDVAGGACGVCSSVNDMEKWLRMHLNNGMFEGRRIVSEKNMREMHSQQAFMPMYPWSSTEIDADGCYGMAWFIQQYRGHKWIWHTGEIEGFCTIEGMVPDIGLTCFLAMSVHKPLNMPLLCSTLYTVFDELLGAEKVDWFERMHAWKGRYAGFHYHWNVDLFEGMPAPVQGTKPSHPLSAYVGDYFHPGYGTYSVEEKEGKLRMRYKDMIVLMEHYHYDVWKGIRFKEDTTVLTAPVTFVTDPYTGGIGSFILPIEPTVEPAVFVRK